MYFLCTKGKDQWDWDVTIKVIIYEKQTEKGNGIHFSPSSMYFSEKCHFGKKKNKQKFQVRKCKVGLEGVLGDC